MLETLVSILNSASQAVYYLLYGSYKTGFYLIATLNFLLSYVISICKSLLSLCVIFADSIHIFVQDLVQLLIHTFSFFTTALEALYGKLVTLYEGIQISIHFIGTIVTNIYYGIGAAIMFLRKLLILFGAGVWFLVTLIPFLLYYMYSWLVTLITKLPEELGSIAKYCGLQAVELVKKCVKLVIEVPIESFLGLLIACLLFYFFRTLPVIRIIAIVRRKFRTRHSGSVASSSKQESLLNKSVNDDKCCVICQEKQKCVLLLPCKHLCLCMQCSQRLGRYSQECPVCRRRIEDRMKVYM